MSKASAARAFRRRYGDLALICGDCGRKVEASLVEEPIPEVTVYWGQCRCGAGVQGIIGPAARVAEVAAFIEGYAAAQGVASPKASWRLVEPETRCKARHGKASSATSQP